MCDRTDNICSSCPTFTLLSKKKIKILIFFPRLRWGPSTAYTSVFLLNSAALWLSWMTRFVLLIVEKKKKSQYPNQRGMKQIGPLLKLIRVIISWIWQANHGLFSHTRQRERGRLRAIIHLQHSDVWKWHGNYSILAWKMALLISRLSCTVILPQD